MLGLESSRRNRLGHLSTRNRRLHIVEPLEQRQLLSVAQSPPGFLDASTLTTQMVDQYGQALIGTDWETEMGLTAEQLYADIQDNTFRTLLNGDENAFIVKFREEIVAMGPTEAQKLFDEELTKAGLPLLDIGHSDWFRDTSSTVETISPADLTAAPATEFVGPVAPGWATVTASSGPAPTYGKSRFDLTPPSGTTSYVFDGTAPIVIALGDDEGGGVVVEPIEDTYISPGETIGFRITWDFDKANPFTMGIHPEDGSAVHGDDYVPNWGGPDWQWPNDYESSLIFYDGNEGQTFEIYPYKAQSDPPVSAGGSDPKRPEQRDFQVIFELPVTIPGEDEGEGVPGVTNPTQIVTIVEPVLPDTPDNGPHNPDGPDDCDCSCGDSASDMSGASALAANGVAQPAEFGSSSGRSIKTKVAPLDGNLLLTQPLISGPLSGETSLTYQSDDGLHPVVTIDPDVPTLPGTSSADKVLLQADAQLFFNGVAQTSATFTSDTGIAQGDPVSFSLQGAAETSPGQYVGTSLRDFVMQVTYQYGAAPGSGPSSPETVKVNYHSLQPVVNRRPSQFGNGWWVNGFDQFLGGDHPMVIFGNGDVALFTPDGIDEEQIYVAPGFGAKLTIDPVSVNTALLTFDDGSTEYFLGSEVSFKETADGYRTDYQYYSNFDVQISDSLGHSVYIPAYGGGVYESFDGGETFLSGATYSVDETSKNLLSVSNDPGHNEPVETTSFSYDDTVYNDQPIGRLQSVTSGIGVTTFNYESASVGRLESITHPDGTTYLVQSVESERLDSQAPDEIPTTSRLPATVTDERGYSSLVTVDPYGNVLTVTNAQSEANVVTYVRDPDGNPTEVTTPDPTDPTNPNDTVSTDYTYENGHVTGASYPDGSSESWTYDANYTDKVHTHTDRLNRLTVYEIDPNTGDMLSERHVVDGDVDIVGDNDVTTSYEYTQPDNPQGLPEGLMLTKTDPLTDPSLRVTTYTYYATAGPSFGELHTITYAAGLPEEATVTYEYNDDWGNLTDYWDEMGRHTHYVYDDFRRLLETDLPDPLVLGDYTTNRSTTLHYDDMGNVASTTNALGQTTYSDYDPAYNDPDTLTVHPRLTVRQPDPNGSNPANQPTTIYDYESAGNLVKVTDPLGRISQYVYNDQNLLASSFAPHPLYPTDPDILGPQTSYTYDTLGLMQTMTDPMLNVTKYAYDVNGRLARTILPHPITVGASGASIYTNYDPESQLTSTIDAKEYTTSYTYDLLGRPWKTFFPDENGAADPETSTIYTENLYDKNGNLTTVRDALTNVTTYVYDNRDRLTDVYLPDPETGNVAEGPHTLTVYLDDGSVDYTVDPMGRTTTYGYDDAGRQTGVTFESEDETQSLTTGTGYDNQDRVTSTTDAGGYKTLYGYDNLDRQTDVYLPHPTTGADGGGPHTITAYDAAGEVTSVTDPLAHVTGYEYDGMGRQKRVTPPDPDGNPATVDTPIVESTYDANSNLKTQTTYVGTTPLVTIYNYDNLNRLKEVIQPNGDTTTYGYDNNNNRTSLLDGAGNETVFEYDTRNRLQSETNELSAARTYLYDHNNNREKATDRNGRVRLFHYDRLNRQTDEQWLDDDDPPNVVYTDSMAYNADGSLQSHADFAGPADTGAPISSYAYGYDKLRRLETVDNGTATPWHVVLTTTNPATSASGYDANGNRTTLFASVNDTADFANTYVYDKINRQTKVWQEGQSGGASVAAKQAIFVYDDNGRMTLLADYKSLTISAPNLVNLSTYTYDADGRLAGLSHNLPGTLYDIAYAWSFDRSNRLSGYARSDGGSQTESQTYGHDDAGQLTSSTGDLPDENYTYDDNGNRLAYTVGPDNRVAFDGTYYYVYEGEGNETLRYDGTTNANVRVLVYDYRNRLTEVKDYTGATVSDGAYVSGTGTLVMEAEYTYDVNNLRIKKDVDGVVTGFVYDRGQVVLEFDGAGNVTNRYLYGPAVDQVLADERSGGVLWALADHLGSVRDIVDNAGAVVDHLTYSAFGQVVSETAPTTHYLFGYTGAVFDIETGLGYHRARYLDHATGRWINQDPFGFAGDPSNLYRYVGNSPTNAVDPTGEAAVFRFTNLGHWPKDWAAFYLYKDGQRESILNAYGVQALTPKQVPAGLTKYGARQHESIAAGYLGPCDIAGSSGAGPCVILVIKLPDGFVRAWHFQGTDSARRTLDRDLNGAVLTGAHAGIAGDTDDSVTGNWLLSEILYILKNKGIKVDGYHKSDELWVDSNGDWVRTR